MCFKDQVHRGKCRNILLLNVTWFWKIFFILQNDWTLCQISKVINMMKTMLFYMLFNTNLIFQIPRAQESSSETIFHKTWSFLKLYYDVNCRNIIIYIGMYPLRYSATPPPAQAGSTQAGCPMTPSSQVLNISPEGDSITSLGHLLQCLTTHMAKIMFLSYVECAGF